VVASRTVQFIGGGVGSPPVTAPLTLRGEAADAEEAEEALSIIPVKLGGECVGILSAKRVLIDPEDPQMLLMPHHRATPQTLLYKQAQIRRSQSGRTPITHAWKQKM
jgi:CBS domain-containing protein